MTLTLKIRGFIFFANICNDNLRIATSNGAEFEVNIFPTNIFFLLLTISREAILVITLCKFEKILSSIL